MAEHVDILWEALSSIPSTEKEKEKEVTRKPLSEQYDPQTSSEGGVTLMTMTSCGSLNMFFTYLETFSKPWSLLSSFNTSFKALQ